MKKQEEEPVVEKPEGQYASIEDFNALAAKVQQLVEAVAGKPEEEVIEAEDKPTEEEKPVPPRHGRLDRKGTSGVAGARRESRPRALGRPPLPGRGNGGSHAPRFRRWRAGEHSRHHAG